MKCMYFPGMSSHIFCAGLAGYLPLSSLLPMAALVTVKKVCMLGCSWPVLSDMPPPGGLLISSVQSQGQNLSMFWCLWIILSMRKSTGLLPPYIVFMQFLGETERCWFEQLFHFRSSYSSSLLFHYDYGDKFILSISVSWKQILVILNAFICL